MKTIMKTILLLGVLCLVGCSSEDPQSVAFSVKEIKVDSESNFIEVYIEANCAWTIKPEKGNPVSSLDAGTGPAAITVSVWENKTYDDVSHTIAIYSEDGTSVDRLNITQAATFGLSATAPEMLDCEGGTFDVKVSTNDEIDKVDVPEWITFTSSRALTSYTYTFTAEPNKTGSPRTSGVRIIGKNKTTQFAVKQDSYAPTSASISNLPKYAFTGEAVTLDVTPEPEYADNSKLSVKVSYNGKELKSTYDNRQVKFNTGNSGEYILEFYEGETLIGSETLMVYDDKVYMQFDCKETCLVGDTINISVDIPIDMCTIEYSAGKNVLKKIDETTYAVIEEGSFAFTATNKLTGYKDKKTFNSKLVLSQSKVECKPSLSEGKKLTTFHTELVSNSVITLVDYRVFGPDGYLVLEKNAYVTHNRTSILIKSFEIPTDKGKHTIWTTLTVDGKTVHDVSYATVQ